MSGKPGFAGDPLKHLVKSILEPKHFGLTTGRFHAMCYAVLERTPFCAIPSNTAKIETLLADIGLETARLFRDAEAWRPPSAFTPDELTAIQTYLKRARAARDRMAFELFGW